MKRPIVSVLVHNLTGNNVVRMYPIAKVLERFSTVDVVGFAGTSGVFKPYRNEFSYKTVPMPRFSTSQSAAKSLRGLVRGDVMYAFKPNPLSLGVGLMERRARGIPLLLDIEDLDSAFFTQRGLATTVKSSFRLWDLQSVGYLALCERMARLADGITVGSTFLQRRYGGTILPHGADTSVFNPSKVGTARSRKKWRIPKAFTILFAGKVSDHKGVDAILRFVRTENTLRGRGVFQLLLVGGQRTDPTIARLLSEKDTSLIHISNQPHTAMPEILSLADVIVLPQRKSTYTQAQVPAKVYEAMAMEKPIIASRVSDLPDILRDSGIIIDPESDSQLGRAILDVYDHRDQAIAMGKNARKRCIARYSWDAMESILKRVFEKHLQ